MTVELQQTEESGKARIVLVDDQLVVRDALARLISQESDLMICGEAADAEEGLAAVEKSSPHAVLVDIGLQGADGLELIKRIRVKRPNLPVLALSAHDEMLYAERVLQAGGQGYVMKREATKHVLGAIRRVLSGEIYLSKKMLPLLLHGMVGRKVSQGPIDRLSDRELEVLRLIGAGRSTREIAEALQLSVKTIETHRSHLKTKLYLSNSSQLAAYAVRQVVQFDETGSPDRGGTPLQDG